MPHKSREPRILIVEENESHGLLMERQIQRRLGDSLIVITGSADEALEFTRTHHFDIAVVDFGVTGCDGLSLLRSIHHLDPDIAVIVVTDEITETVTREVFRCGGRELLIKDGSYYVVVPRMVAGLYQRIRTEPGKFSRLRRQTSDSARCLQECLRDQLRDPIQTIIETAGEIIAGSANSDGIKERVSAIRKSAMEMKSSLGRLVTPCECGCPKEKPVGGVRAESRLDRAKS